MSLLKKIKSELHAHACPNKALSLQRFFKRGEGEYGEGERFLGITVPLQRQIAKSYASLSFSELEVLLRSKLHEERLTALLILILQYQLATSLQQKRIYDFYFANVAGINNWDLVDLSAPKIVGPFLLDKNKKHLYELVRSKSLWERRIAIVATIAFIRENSFTDTLSLTQKLLKDKEDLLHKAAGWMLREVGKRDFEVLSVFLREYYHVMPRTMLRYAIEKFPEKLRLAYLHGCI